MSLGIYFSDIARIETDAIFDIDVVIDGVSIDTRSISEGETYLAIKGEHHDGHDYVEQAILSGASSVVVSRKGLHVSKPSLLVRNTIVTLGNIANLHRNKLPGNVIGITGSNGKTTVKEMVAGIAMAYGKTTYTKANQNNTIGVPLTLLSSSEKDSVIVVEMGTSEAGEIAYLSKVVSPDVALINNISESHLEGIGQKEDVFIEKSAIIRFARQGGTIVLNADDEYTPLALGLVEDRNVLTFGMENKADISATFEHTNLGTLVNAVTPSGPLSYELKVPGRHNVENSLAAVAVAMASNIEHESIIEGLENFEGVYGRLRVIPLGGESWLIDDSYNANPSSSRAALDVLSGYPGRKIFVYGGMAELGSRSDACHRDVGIKAAEIGVDIMLVLSGNADATMEDFGNTKHSCKDVDDICKLLANTIRGGDVVLVKGSRRFHMDGVVKFLQESLR